MDDSASIGPSRIKKCCKHMLTMGHLTETLTRKAQRDQSEIRKWVAKKERFARDAKFVGLSKPPCTDALNLPRRT